MRTNKKGFTLIEVLAVVVLIGILSLLVAPQILDYFDENKDSYNKKLSEQLRLFGKTYYSDNKLELPTETSEKKFSLVTVPEMKSRNYISKDLVDSEGRNCSESYVYAKLRNDTEYDYIPCLRCVDDAGNVVNHNEENIVCNISNTNDNVPPTCEGPGITEFKDSITLGKVDDKDGNGNDGKIIGIRITNRNKVSYDISTFDMNNNDIAKINLSEKIKEKFKNKDDIYTVQIVDSGGNFSESCGEITVGTPQTSLDDGSCSVTHSNGNLIIENLSSDEDDSIEGIYYVDYAGVENQISPSVVAGQSIPFNVTDYSSIIVKRGSGSDILCKENYDNIGDYANNPPVCSFIKNAPSVVQVGETVNLEVLCKGDNGQPITSGNVQINALKGKTYGNLSYTSKKMSASQIKFNITYTGTKASNNDVDQVLVGNGVVKNVKQNASGSNLESGAISSYQFRIDLPGPKCAFTSVPSGYIKKSGATLKAKCEGVNGSSIRQINTGKVISKTGKGTITSVTPSTLQGNSIVYTIKYIPKDGQSGKEKVVIQAGKVQNADNNRTNYETESAAFDVDTKGPKITFEKLKCDEHYAWKKKKKTSSKYCAKKVKVKVTCTDSQSGVKTLKVGDGNDEKTKIKKAHVTSNPVTITKKGRGKYIIGAICTDKAGNKTTKYSPQYRVLEKTSSCKMCETKTYKPCRNKAFGCELYSAGSKCGCAKYGTYSCPTTTYSWANKRKRTSGAGGRHCGVCNATSWNNMGGDFWCTYSDGSQGYERQCVKSTVYKTCKSSSCSAYNRCASEGCDKYNKKAKAPCKCNKGKKCWY